MSFPEMETRGLPTIVLFPADSVAKLSSPGSDDTCEDAAAIIGDAFRGRAERAVTRGSRE
jgi:hypothetical protein